MINPEPTIQRVMHVIYSGLGGHAAVLFSLLEAGFFRGAEHHVVLAGVEPPLPDYTERLEQLGIPWSYVGKIAGGGRKSFYVALRRQFRAQKPDLIFLNGLAAVPATIGLGKPLVLLRESEPVQLKRKTEWALLALAHASVDRIVHLTPEAAQGAKAVLGPLVRSRKVHIIPNGINTDFFAPIRKHSLGKRIEIGMVSRLQHKKDHITLIAAIDDLRQRYEDREFRLHIAGSGTSRTRIETEIENRGLNNMVSFHGVLDQVGVRDLMRSLDFYVHATFGETMSNSIMQAMATELPIVASDVNGVSNMLREDCGALYPSQDAEALADQLDRWIANPDEAICFAKRARNRAKVEYDLARISAQYENVVKAAISRNAFTAFVSRNNKEL